MELQLQKSQIPYLHTVKRELQTQEQTQEVRISDGMPDIGNVIGTWGQVILRSKEWESDAMRVSGGTMVWVLYNPEEGGQPQLVESWIPFQMRWDFPPTQYDGEILAKCILKSVDARITSARKLMLRSNVAVLGQGMDLQLAELFTPTELPEDIQLQAAAYPMRIPVEAGEKAFTLEDTLPLPPSSPAMEQLLYYRVLPEVTEEKIMNDKLVFRGTATLHVCYQAEDGAVHKCDFPLPFSQYSELDREYDQTAEADFWPCVTALETEKEDGQIRVKMGLVCQYRISHEPLITVVEDAYSPLRSVTPQFQTLELPGILDRKKQNIHLQTAVPAEGMRLVDVQVLPQPVQIRTQGEERVLELPALAQSLFYDMDGQLHANSVKWEQTMQLPAGEDASVEATLWAGGTPAGSLMSGNLQLQADLRLDTETLLGKGLSIVSALEVGDVREPDPNRPSLILRRTGEQSLWQIAKDTGSTMDAIRQANDLQSEPTENQWLLIPVL